MLEDVAIELDEDKVVWIQVQDENKAEALLILAGIRNLSREDKVTWLRTRKPILDSLSPYYFETMVKCLMRPTEDPHLSFGLTKVLVTFG